MRSSGDRLIAFGLTLTFVGAKEERGGTRVNLKVRKGGGSASQASAVIQGIEGCRRGFL